MESTKQPIEEITINQEAINEIHQSYEELYQQKIILFCTLCNCFPNLSWKAKKNFNEEVNPMFQDSFITGIHTPRGLVTYYVKQKYWDLFQISELERSPIYEYYAEQEGLQRILSLTNPNFALIEQQEEIDISPTLALLKIRNKLQFQQEVQEQKRIDEARSRWYK